MACLTEGREAPAVGHSETGRSVQGPEAGRGGDSMPHAGRAAGVAWRGVTVSCPGVPGWLHPSRETHGDPGCRWSSGGKQALPGGPEACARPAGSDSHSPIPAVTED